MRYLRGRKLSMAAYELAQGEQDILGLAINTGYNSHEAFTRAFRTQFGITPEQVRQLGSVESLDLVEAIKIQDQVIDIAPPKLISSGPMIFQGLMYPVKG